MRFHTTVAAVALVALLSGCNVLQQLESRKIMAAAVLASPSLAPFTPASVTTAQLFFGERQDNVQQPPTALSASSVTLTWDGNSSGVTLTPVAGKAGWYEATGGVTYIEGAHYTFTVVYQGETFSGSVQAPAASAITNASNHLFNPGAYDGTKLTVTRDVSAGASDAFYAAFHASGATDLASSTCNNAPVNDASVFVQFVLDDSAWKAASFSLPKSPCFPSTGQYVVNLTTVEKSTAVSSNLFLGSAVLAGTADAAALVVP